MLGFKIIEAPSGRQDRHSDTSVIRRHHCGRR